MLQRHVNVVAAVIVADGKVMATQRGYGEWKDWWEFPGGKIESGETPAEALRREIHEELDTDIETGRLLTTVEYDYPTFHLTMHCILCRLPEGARPRLLEHEAARWLAFDNLHSVRWLPADIQVIDILSGMRNDGLL
ncbi:MAG: (deoxy)nucleoside triphosphate pyrophosphohydrolase [Prevotella sp.]